MTSGYDEGNRWGKNVKAKMAPKRHQKTDTLLTLRSRVFAITESDDEDTQRKRYKTDSGTHRTYAFVERWLVGSWRTASSFSSSSLFLREPGTDLEGSWSSKANRDCIIPDCGEASWEPDRPGRLNMPGGEVRLEVE